MENYLVLICWVIILDSKCTHVYYEYINKGTPMYYSPRHLARIQQFEARKALKFWYRAFTVALAVGLWMTVWFVWALS